MGFWPQFQPRVGLNFGASSLALVKLKGRGRSSHLHRYQVHKMSKEFLIPSPTGRNIQKPEEIKKIIQNLFEEEKIRRQPISLSLPDLAVKVLLLKLDHLPKKKEDLDQLVRWNMEKTFLSPLKEAQLSYQILKRGKSEGKKHYVVASMIQRNILCEYEDLIRSLGCYPVLIDISSFHVLNLCREILSKEISGEEGFLFVNVFDSNFTIMIFSHGLPDFIRIKGFQDRQVSAPGEGVSRSEKITEEIETSFRFYRREGPTETINTIFLFGGPQMSDLISPLEERFPLKVHLLDLQPFVAMDGFSSVDGEDVPFVIPALAAAMGR
ncbi:MAG TPA: pilus assembly protein PilM [Nitrospiria bacterium]